MTKKKPPCGYCGEMGMFSPGCPKCGRKKRRTGRDRQLEKVPFGRRATATADASPAVTCERCSPNSCLTAPGSHGQKARAAVLRERRLPAMVKDAKKTSARALDELAGGGSPRLAKLEIAPGRLVQICPIPGKEKILHKVGMVEVRVEIMFTPDGDLVIETSIEGLVVGTANVADHLQIK